MPNPRKLLWELLSGSRDLRFEDFLALIEAFGFIHKRTSGSHRIYLHPKIPRPFPVQPRGDGKAKPYQVEQLLKMIEQYDLELEKD